MVLLEYVFYNICMRIHSWMRFKYSRRQKVTLLHSCKGVAESQVLGDLGGFSTCRSKQFA